LEVFSSYCIYFYEVVLIFLKLVKYNFLCLDADYHPSIWVRNRRPCTKELAAWPNAFKWHLDIFRVLSHTSNP